MVHRGHSLIACCEPASQNRCPVAESPVTERVECPELAQSGPHPSALTIKQAIARLRMPTWTAQWRTTEPAVNRPKATRAFVQGLIAACPRHKAHGLKGMSCKRCRRFRDAFLPPHAEQAVFVFPLYLLLKRSCHCKHFRVQVSLIH